MQWPSSNLALPHKRDVAVMCHEEGVDLGRERLQLQRHVGQDGRVDGLGVHHAALGAVVRTHHMLQDLLNLEGETGLKIRCVFLFL